MRKKLREIQDRLINIEGQEDIEGTWEIILKAFEKSHDSDGVQVYWMKKLRYLKGGIAQRESETLHETAWKKPDV